MDNFERSKNYKIEVFYSSLLNFITMSLGLVLIPLCIHFLGEEIYGLWATILSIGAWTGFVDFGIGNGMRNKVAESIAINNTSLAKGYISSAYISLGIVILTLILIASITFNFIDFKYLYNFNENGQVLKITTWYVLVAVLINLSFSLVNSVMSAIQKSRFTPVLSILNNILFILFLIAAIFFKIEINKLSFIGIIYFVSVVLSGFLCNIIFFQKNKNLLPELSQFKISLVKSMSSLGFKFFVIQFAVMVVFSTDNMIITQLLGPKFVTSYSITQKIFLSFFAIAGIVMAPLWSAYTDAYSKGDLHWIKTKMLFLLKLFLPYIFCISLLVWFFQDIKNLWVGSDIEISNSLVILMALFSIVLFWNSIFAMFLNGIGKIELQFRLSVLAAIVNIPLSIFLTRNCEMNLDGIILATILSLLLSSFLSPIQTFLILYKKPKGIWDK